MPALAPKRRDALLAVAALALFSGPVVASSLHLGEEAVRLERAEVVVENESIVYAGELPRTSAGYVGISQDIACRESVWTSRVCYFERYLAGNDSVGTDEFERQPGPPPEFGYERYDYVALQDGVYEPGFNASERVNTGYPDGVLYRVHLTLNPVPTREALREVAVDEREVSAAVRRAATTGTATVHEDVTIPQTPVRVSPTEHYRVYEAGVVTAGLVESLVRLALTYLAPFVGLVCAIEVALQFEYRPD